MPNTSGEREMNRFKAGDMIEVIDRNVAPYLLRGTVIEMDEHPLDESFAKIRINGAAGAYEEWVNIRLARAVAPELGGKDMALTESIEQVAKVCHEANRAYCETLGDNSQPPWGSAPEWQKQSARNGVKFHFAQLATGIEPSPSASHEKWLEEKRATGWQYGPTKDPEKKLHPCFLPYDQLPLDQRMKDYIFAAIAKAFAVAVEIAGE